MAPNKQEISDPARSGPFPQYETELQTLLNSAPGISRESLRPEGILALRKDFVGPSVAELVAGRAIQAQEHVFLATRVQSLQSRPSGQTTKSLMHRFCFTSTVAAWLLVTAS